MTKSSRLSLIRARWTARRRFVSSVLAVAAVSIDTAQDSTIGIKDADRRIRQVVSERATNDSISDSDKIEATISKLEFDSVETSGWTGSAILTRSERARLAIEHGSYKFAQDVAKRPLLLTA